MVDHHPIRRIYRHKCRSTVQTRAALRDGKVATLSYLRSMPIRKVEIDRSFIRGMAERQGYLFHQPMPQAQFRALVLAAAPG